MLRIIGVDDDGYMGIYYTSLPNFICNIYIIQSFFFKSCERIVPTVDKFFTPSIDTKLWWSGCSVTSADSANLYYLFPMTDLLRWLYLSQFDI